jgi:signal transduction histidine kinase
MKKDRSRRTLWVLAVAMVLPIGVLSWLSVRLLQQDRDAERQRQSDALQVRARTLALDMLTWLQDLEPRMMRGEGIPLSGTGPEPSRDLPLLYRASVPVDEQIRTAELKTAENLEYRSHDLVAAVRAYRAAAETNAMQVRAAALLGLGGVLSKVGELDGALAAYTELGRLPTVQVAGQPAGLVALNARCRSLERAGHTARLRSEAVGFARTLHAGGWLIDRPTFEHYQDSLQRWGAPEPPREALARTRAAIGLWEAWRDGTLSIRGQRLIRTDSETLLATWTTTASRPVLWLTTSSDLNAALGPVARTHKLRITAYDDEDRVLFGEGDVAGPLMTKGETRLPFALRVADLDLAAVHIQERRRRLLLITSLSIAFVLMIAAAGVLYRTTVREVALARQQADFVSAVSHEFRTPLTSMRHLADLLATRQVSTEERRAHYYRLLTAETERLNRLVESLLSFGRIEAGGYAWRLQPTDVGRVVASVADEFRHEGGARLRMLYCEVEPDLPAVRADVDALSRAVWNLLDNAIKYSAPDAPVSVTVTRSGSSVSIAVGDRGIGIRPEGFESVFRKFVRGAAAKQAGIGGVGIGLALVNEIVTAHGGSVRLKSEPGHGSTFTLVIPCIES